TPRILPPPLSAILRVADKPERMRGTQFRDEGALGVSTEVRTGEPGGFERLRRNHNRRMFQEVAMQAALDRSVASAETTRPTQPAFRTFSIDACGGFVLRLMLAGVLQLSGVARVFRGTRFGGCLAYPQTHVAWAACSLHDPIHPGFSSLV